MVHSTWTVGGSDISVVSHELTGGFNVFVESLENPKGYRVWQT